MSQNNLSMFKSYDIRTKSEKLNDNDIDTLANAIACYYKNDIKAESVTVARDARLAGPRVASAIINALINSGIDVYTNPLQTSTCLFYYMCMRNRDAGGIMVTASHNPKEYIGCKLVGKNVEPIATGCGPSGGISKIKEYYIADKKDESKKKGRIHVVNFQMDYIHYSMKLAGVRKGDLKGLRIFGEFLSGASGTDFALAFEEAGAELALDNLIPDGYFPSGDPNPIIETSIAPARILMKEGGYDLGFCFDGDGDRMDLMYPDGSQVIPGLNISILIPYIKDIFSPYFKDGRIKFYADVKAIPLSIMEIARRDIDVHIIRNGHSFIKAKLRDHLKEGFVASEEESAHYYMNFPYDIDDFSKGFAAVENTLFFALLSARAMKERKEEYERIYKLQQDIHRYREWPLNFDAPEKMECIMQEVEDEMKKRGALVIKDMDDGSDLDATLMRFNLPAHFDKDMAFPDNWIQVAERISRSEDAMTRWEVVAATEEDCNKINDIIKEIADRYVKEGLAHY